MTPITIIDTFVVDDVDSVDDAADTLRFTRIDFDDETPTDPDADPDATSFYDLTTPPTVHLGIQRASASRRRLIRETREIIAGLRGAVAAGWDVGPELAFEQRRLAALEVG